MKHTHFVWLSAIALGGCGNAALSTVDDTIQPPPHVGVAATAIDPSSMRAIMHRSAALVEGTVFDVRYAYDAQIGPRTIISLSVDAVHAGRYEKSVVELPFFGGPTPDGRFFSTSLSVDFVKGGTYLVLLSGVPWHYSPTTTSPLRVDSVGGREVLVNPEGRLLTAVTPQGFRYSGDSAFHEERPDGVVRTRGEVKAKASVAPAEALARRDFVALFHEAEEVEDYHLGGSYVDSPEVRGPDWRIQPTTPPADTEGAQ